MAGKYMRMDRRLKAKRFRPRTCDIWQSGAKAQAAPAHLWSSRCGLVLIQSRLRIQPGTANANGISDCSVIKLVRYSRDK